MRMTVGVDESGCGAIAGPLISVACHIDEKALAAVTALGFTDSKTLSRAKRQELLQGLVAIDGVSTVISLVSAEDYDRLGPSKAWQQCLRTSVKLLLYRLDVWNQPEVSVIVDGNKAISGLPAHWHQTPLVRADSLDLRCAVASVVAKEHRDRLMTEVGQLFPLYGFANHFGYATPEHLMALMEVGPLLDPHVHRRRLLNPKNLKRFAAKHWHRVLPTWCRELPARGSVG